MQDLIADESIYPGPLVSVGLTGCWKKRIVYTALKAEIDNC